jgi:hypothetical protein
MNRAVALGAVALLAALPGEAQESGGITPPTSFQSPRNGAVEFRLGGYKPRIDSEPALEGKTPYADTFGNKAMLLAELEFQRFFYQGIGTAGASVSVGYAERYAAATDVAGNPVSERTALKVVPIRLNALYKFDYAAFKWHIPLVPYGKVGLVYTPWWSTKGDSTEVATLGDESFKGSGGKWGYALTGGVSFLLDVLEPRLARDFDMDLGVNHTYLFAEYSFSEVNNFGGAGFNLGSHNWMFGFAFDY